MQKMFRISISLDDLGKVIDDPERPGNIIGEDEEFAYDMNMTMYEFTFPLEAKDDGKPDAHKIFSILEDLLVSLTRDLEPHK